MRMLFGILAVVALAACGGPIQDPTDVEVGLDEAAACPTPSAYCATIGYYWSGCAAEGTSQTNNCWLGGANRADLEFLKGSYTTNGYFYNYSGYNLLPTNHNCPTVYTGSDYRKLGVTSSGYGKTAKCHGDAYENHSWWEVHLVANPGKQGVPFSDCYGYVECYDN